jgi:hypothetical protein
MSSAGTVTVDFAAETSKFTNEVKKVRADLAALKQESASVGKALGSIGDTVKGIITVGAVLGAVHAVIKATADAERAQALLNNAIEAAGAPLKAASADFSAYASQLQRTTVFNDEAIMQVETLLLSFQGLSGETIKRATESVLNISERMGIDAPAAAKLLGKALQDPEKGMTALAKAGVAFSASQKETIKDLKASGDAAGAQSLILGELEKRFGGAAAAARSTFGGALTGLKNAFGDLLEGKSGINEASQGINALADTLSSPEVQRSFATLIAGLAKFIELSAKVAAAVPRTGEAIGKGVAKMLHGAIPVEQWDLDEIQLRMKQLQAQRDAMTESVPNWQKNSGVTQQIRIWDDELARLQARLTTLNGLTIRGSSGSTSKGPDFITGGAAPEVDPETDSQVAKRQKAALDLATAEYEGRQAVEDLVTSLHQDEINERVQMDIDYLVASQRLNDEAAAAITAENSAYVDGYAKRAEEVLAIEMQAQAQLEQFRANGLSAAAGLLEQMVGKHKLAATALFAFQKRADIAKALITTKAAVLESYKNAGGWPFGVAAAAGMAAIGAAQIASIVGINIGSSGSVGSIGGGGASSLGTPVGVERAAANSGPRERGLPQQTVVQVIVNGNNYGFGNFEDTVIEAVKNAIGRDVVPIHPGSRQALEIREG